MRPPFLWAVGVTTQTARLVDFLPRTLESLRGAGFAEPRLFVDGAGESLTLSLLPADYRQLSITARSPAVGAFANWWLALVELWCRTPNADRYVVFQDDLLAVRGLRAYLDRTARQPNAYWNLYTFLDNEAVVRGLTPGTWVEGAIRGAARGNPNAQRLQCGAGALGLVFTREGVMALLQAKELAMKPADSRRSTKNIDGAVVDAMNAAGFREWVHSPSLLYHAGRLSTVEPGKEWVSHAKTWSGEDYPLDALGRVSG